MKTTNSVSAQLKQARKQQVKEITLEAFSLRAALIACVRANRVPALEKFYKSAGVPNADASNSNIEDWGFKAIREILPHYYDGDKYKQIALTRDATKAVKFTESDEVGVIKNVDGVESKTLPVCVEGALHVRLFYVTRKTKVPQYIKLRYPDGTMHDVPEYDKQGKRVYKDGMVAEYICVGAGRYSINQVSGAFLKLIGVPAAIAAAENEEAALRAAKEIANEALKTGRLAKKAKEAAQTADAMREKADEAAQTVKELCKKHNMTLGEAADIYKTAAATGKKADDDAALAPQGCRKKSNTRTKASKVVDK